MRTGKHHHLKHAFMFPRTSVKVGNLSRATAKHQQVISHIHSQLHLFALLVTPHIRSGRRSFQRLQKGLRRALSPLVPLAVFVAGAVPRASRRGCGARCRRWCRWLSSWQAKYPEPPEGAAARVVAAGAAGCLPRGRRSTQSLTEGAAARVVAAGAACCPPRGRRSTQSLMHRRGCGARCRRWCRLLSSSRQAQYPEPPEGAAARVVAAGAACCLPRGRRSTRSLQKGLRRALSPLVPLAVLVAGAVPRAPRRGCGARCRRWCRWLSSWQAQYPEPPEGAAARTVAAGAAGCPRGRRSTQSLQKGLRRALSRCRLLSSAWQAQYPEPHRRGCGARCRRWCRLLSCSWQAQYPEPPEGAAARVVAAGAACCPHGRRGTQSLQKGLRRALSPLVLLAVLMAGAVPRASRRGCGARCRRWLSSWLAQYPEPHRRGCGARCRRWCRLLSSWQAQYPEPPEGAAARVVAAGAACCLPRRGSTQSLQKGLWRALSPLVPLAVFLVAGAVPRASRRGCGARCRRWCRLLSSWQAQYPEPPWGLRRALPLVPLAVLGAAGCLPRGRRSIQSLQKGLRRALSPLVPLAAFRVAGAVSRVSRRGCGARCRRWCRLLSSWQAQYPEPPQRAAARVVAAGAAGCPPRGRRSTHCDCALLPL